MKETTLRICEELFERYSSITVEKENILNAFSVLLNAYKNGKKLLVCGNGGSAADSEHIVGELMKQFKKPRKIKHEISDSLKNCGKEGEMLAETLEGSLRAISLTSHLSLLTAFANDKNPSVVFAHQLYGLADGGDVLLTISTS